MSGTFGGEKLPPNPNTETTFDPEALREIYLAGGCFWGVEAFMARLPGVAETEVGYANGTTANPTYEEVCKKNTGYAETVRVRYDPRRLPLEKLVSTFFAIIDPLSENRQGADVGAQYRTGVYYTLPVSPEELKSVEFAFEKEAARHKQPLAVEMKPLLNFYPAEDYHQKYLEKNPNGYCHVNLDILEDVR